MEILRQLGLDGTVWIQLGFFLTSYIFISQFIFKPYLRNLDYRARNTGSDLKDLNQTTAQADAVAAQYAQKVTEQNREATAVFSQMKQEGAAAEEKIFTAARKRSSEYLEETKKSIKDQVGTARDTLKLQVPQLSSQVASRVLGRELK